MVLSWLRLQFQEGSGLPSIDETTLQGLQDLLGPGKDIADFS